MRNTTNQTTEYTQGYYGYDNHDENPYQPGTKQYAEWESGFNDALADESGDAVYERNHA